MASTCLGQSMFIRLGIDSVEEMSVGQEQRIELVRAVADVVHRYIDWILQYVSDVHEAERRRWGGGRSAARANAVTRLLRGETNVPVRFEVETGFSYEVGRFVALIVWSAEEGPGVAPAVSALAQRLAVRWRGPRAPLVVPEDPKTFWVWVPIASGAAPSSADVRVDLEQAGRMRAVLGTPGAGLPGFRSSHAEAVDTRMVALTSLQHQNEPVLSHGDPAVSLLAMFARDLPTSQRWMRSVLGPLARADDDAAAQRETFRAYIESGSNVTLTAQTLGVHRNTVRRRLGSMTIAGQPKDQLAVAMALRLYDAFGSGA